MGCVPFPGRLYEQHLNAAGAQDLGVPVIKSLKKKHLHKVENWLKEKDALHIHFPDNTEKIIDLVLAMPVVKAVATMPAKSLPAKGILLPRWI
jgi:hypothetical protein